MPVIAFGSGSDMPKNESLVPYFKNWLDIGGRHFDTAFIYGDEAILGKFIATQTTVRRSELFVTTKIPGPLGYDRTIELVLNHTIPKLSKINMLLIHFPCIAGNNGQCPAQKEARLSTWRAMLDLKYKYKVVAAIGVSQYEKEHLEELVGMEMPEVNQHLFNLGVHDESLLHFAKQHHTLIEAYSPLRSQRDGGIGFDNPALVKMAALHKKSVPQVMLRWIIQKDMVFVFSTQNPRHMASDVDIFDFELSPSEVAVLTNLVENKKIQVPVIEHVNYQIKKRV